MNSLQISQLSDLSFSSLRDQVLAFPPVPIQQCSWKDYPFRPKVKLRTGWNKNYLLLHFMVDEPYIRAAAKENNGRVWEDSCVEFFVSPENNQEYYNFEFNCTGKCYLAYGTKVKPRNQASLEVLGKIICSGNTGTEPFETRPSTGVWELFIAIPPSAFFRHSIKEFIPAKMRANFYKCGDKLPQPHFLSWSMIETPRPDFHQPDFFGEINLAQ